METTGVPKKSSQTEMAYCERRGEPASSPRLIGPLEGQEAEKRILTNYPSLVNEDDVSSDDGGSTLEDFFPCSSLTRTENISPSR